MRWSRVVKGRVATDVGPTCSTILTVTKSRLPLSARYKGPIDRGRFVPSPLRQWLPLALLAFVLSGCGAEVERTGLLTEIPITVVETTSGGSNSSSTSSSTAPTFPTTTTLAATTSSTITTEPNPWPLALAVLDVMVVAPEYSSGYQRELFPHWSVSDGCSTRDRVLIEESTSFAQVDPFGCRVIAGDWLSAFDGRTWDDPAEIQIDHLVALKEAWESGAWSWTESQRRSFANDRDDPRPLNAITGSVNQSKSDRDPPNWMPPLMSARCPYVADWIAVKARWQLTVDAIEKNFLQSYVRTNCPDLRIAPWETVPVSTSTNTVAPTAPPATIDTDGGTSGSVYYANCTEARAAGAAPILVGEPGYRVAMDRDKDGIACE